MLIELSYMHGMCPLCGARPGSIKKLNNINLKKQCDNYASVTVFEAECMFCKFKWFVQTYLLVGDDKQVFSCRRNLIELQDLKLYYDLFRDMVYMDGKLCYKELIDVLHG